MLSSSSTWLYLWSCLIKKDWTEVPDQLRQLLWSFRFCSWATCASHLSRLWCSKAGAHPFDHLTWFAFDFCHLPTFEERFSYQAGSWAFTNVDWPCSTSVAQAVQLDLVLREISVAKATEQRRSKFELEHSYRCCFGEAKQAWQQAHGWTYLAGLCLSCLSNQMCRSEFLLLSIQWEPIWQSPEASSESSWSCHPTQCF